MGIKRPHSGNGIAKSTNMTTIKRDIQKLYNHPETQKFLEDYRARQQEEGYLPKDSKLIRSNLAGEHFNVKKLSTTEEYNKNLNALNQFMGSAKRLLREIHLEAQSPSKDCERLERLEKDMVDVLKDFLIQARLRHQSLCEESG